MEDGELTEYKNIGDTPRKSPITSSDLISSDILPSSGEGGTAVGCDLTFLLEAASCSHRKHDNMNKYLQSNFSIDPANYAGYHSGKDKCHSA